MTKCGKKIKHAMECNDFQNIACNVGFITLQKTLCEKMILKYCNAETLHLMLTSTHCKKKLCNIDHYTQSSKNKTCVQC